MTQSDLLEVCEAILFSVQLPPGVLEKYNRIKEEFEKKERLNKKTEKDQIHQLESENAHLSQQNTELTSKLHELQSNFREFEQRLKQLDNQHHKEIEQKSIELRKEFQDQVNEAMKALADEVDRGRRRKIEREEELRKIKSLEKKYSEFLSINDERTSNDSRQSFLDKIDFALEKAQNLKSQLQEREENGVLPTTTSDKLIQIQKFCHDSLKSLNRNEDKMREKWKNLERAMTELRKT